MTRVRKIRRPATNAQIRDLQKRVRKLEQQMAPGDCWSILLTDTPASKCVEELEADIAANYPGCFIVTKIHSGRIDVRRIK